MESRRSPRDSIAAVAVELDLAQLHRFSAEVSCAAVALAELAIADVLAASPG
jgi:hypothetical protein